MADGQMTIILGRRAGCGFLQHLLEDLPGVTKLNGKKIENVTNPYTMQGLERGKKYYLVVTAVEGSIESKESEEVSFEAK
ncbi:MAG: fibronectin type III domain-containing protein [Desulfobacterales bacterium]|nr:fibronectin type III domain-containing protein [Desulfobacterales bacterium]